MAKLDPEAVRYAREMLNTGIGRAIVARHLGVHPETIRAIEKGITWKHVR